MNLVLAIENDPNTSADLDNFLQGHRMRVIITGFSNRLVDYIKSADPDVILIGLTLNSSKELEFVIELKKDPFTEKIPIIALLGRKDDNFEFNHKILGFTDYLVKPFAKTILLDKVKNVIKEYSSYRKTTADSVDSHIDILSHGFETTIYLRSSLSLYVSAEIKDTFNQTMMQRLREDTICIDIRGLFDMIKSELSILQNIIGLFEGKNVSIIAGKYLGMLLENGFGNEGENIFMTPEEYSRFLIERKT